MKPKDYVEAMLLNKWDYLTAARELEVNTNKMVFWFGKHWMEVSRKIEEADKENKQEGCTLTGMITDIVHGRDNFQFQERTGWVDAEHIKNYRLDMLVNAIEGGAIRRRPKALAELENQIKNINSI